MQTTYPLRLDEEEKRLFKQSARSAGLSLAQFLRDAAKEKAARTKKEPACFKYLDEVTLSHEAEKNPKAFIAKKIREKHHR
jgi:uncharacterized protein (DUF1778 family)